MSIVVEVEELVAPLGDDAESILEERHDDQETSDGREVSKARAPVSSMARWGASEH